MSIIKAKKSITLLAGIMAIAALGSIAQAETRLAVQDSTGTVDKMVVTDQGFIGIGKSTPPVAVFAEGATLNNSQVFTHFVGTSTSGGGGFVGYHNNAAGALPNSGDRLGYFYFGSIDPTSGSGKNAAGISATAGTAWSSTSTPANMLFETANTTGSRLERMRITYYGYLGVGTVNPQQRLDVAGAIRTTNSTSKPTCNNTIRGSIWFYKNDTASSGAPDSLDICAKDNTGAFVWKSVF